MKQIEDQRTVGAEPEAENVSALLQFPFSRTRSMLQPARVAAVAEAARVEPAEAKMLDSCSGIAVHLIMTLVANRLTRMPEKA